MLLIDMCPAVCPEQIHDDWKKAYLCAREIKETTELNVFLMAAENHRIEGFALVVDDRILYAVPITEPDSDVACLLSDFCEWIDSVEAAEG